jgi:hypothetical protein
MRPTMRAYSHQGHGPRADQTGRIHISDFRNPRTISLAKRSRSIHVGQFRKSNGVRVRSAGASTTDMRRLHRHVGFVSETEVAAYSITSSASASSDSDTSTPSAFAGVEVEIEHSCRILQIGFAGRAVLSRRTSAERPRWRRYISRVHCAAGCRAKSSRYCRRLSGRATARGY